MKKFGISYGTATELVQNNWRLEKGKGKVVPVL
jgi:hypothetical protein